MNCTPHGSHKIGIILVLPRLECPDAQEASLAAAALELAGITKYVLATRDACTGLYGWKNLVVGKVSRDEAVAIARRHCQNCERTLVLDSLDMPDLSTAEPVKPEPFTAWAPVRGGVMEKAWEGAREVKPWAPFFDCELSIPCLDAGDTIREIVALWRLQTKRPYIVLIDTGSTPEQHAILESLRGDDLEVHVIRANGYHHPSDPVAIACDLAFSMCRSPVSVMTHSDVFPRRRDVLEELLRVCSARCPALGYRMTERMFPGWEKVVSHTLSAFWMETMWKIGGGWSLARLCSRRKIGHYPNSALASMPDTEVLLSDILEENGIQPLFIGEEINYEQTVDHRIRHVRSLAGARLYSPAHAAKAQGWLTEALAEAAINLHIWRGEDL